MKNKLGIFILIVMILATMLLGTACDNSKEKSVGSVEEEHVVLKAGTTVAPTHPYNLGLEEFNRLLKEKTNGKYSVEVYASSQLGSEKEIIEGIQMATVDIGVVSTSPLASFTDAFKVTDLPFLFKDKAHAYAVLDGEIGQSMFEKLEGSGIKGLAYWESGFRHVTNSKKPILTPEDMKGIKIRVMENKVHIDSFREIGADPTPMAFGELFTALQQETVDAEESPLPTIYTSKFYEVQEYITLTGHLYPPAPMIISQSLWNSLSDDERVAFQEAANGARDFEREANQKMEDELLVELEKLGMKFTTPDKSIWQEAMAPVYEKYAEEFGRDKIKSIQELKY